jgi:hypothetical protein
VLNAILYRGSTGYRVAAQCALACWPHNAEAIVDSIESWTTELLRRQAGRALSLQQLHALLLQELGPGAGTYHQLHQRLKKTAAPLRLLERTHPFPAEQDWPEDARARYQQALQDAGYDPSPIVALSAASEEAPDVLDELRTTLLDLSEQLQQESHFSADIVAALSGLAEIQEQAARAARPTILPLDPLPERENPLFRPR